jgi:hypothetical protein
MRVASFPFFAVESDLPVLSVMLARLPPAAQAVGRTVDANLRIEATALRPEHAPYARRANGTLHAYGSDTAHASLLLTRHHIPTHIRIARRSRVCRRGRAHRTRHRASQALHALRPLSAWKRESPSMTKRVSNFSNAGYPAGPAPQAIESPDSELALSQSPQE